MKPYKYSNLNGDEIRLLHLLPHSVSREVRLRIETVTLSADQVPQYEALSYAWGSPKGPSSVVVTVDHMFGSKNRARSLAGIVSFSTPRSISVTRNLAEALPYLRDATKPRTLWIDAICIDQKNSKEKGKQVSRMGEIYKSSSRVLVWLGREMSPSSAVFEFLNQLSSQISVDWAAWEISSTPGAVMDWKEMVHSFYNSEKLVNDLTQLVTRPWFERLWVWQEIRAKGNALVMCSYDRILWQDLCSATYALLAFEQREDLSKHLVHLQQIGDQHLNIPLEAYSSMTRRCICADSRDRIFALKALLSPKEGGAIKPDYDKSTSEVYRDVVVEYALNLGKLNLLRLCDLSTKLEESPSWVPNFSSPQHDFLVTTFNASGRSIYETKVGMEFMEVAGVYCATVTQAEYLFDADASDKEVMSKLSEIVSLRDMNASYIGGGNMLSAYCCTLFQDLFNENYLPNRSEYYSFEYSLGILQDIIIQNKDHELQLTSDISLYVDAVRKVVAGQTIFVTREGYIGTSLVDPRLGDQIVVPLGCDYPLLLRAARDSHQVVGQCYVQSLMYAEALLGLLSEGWQHAQLLDEISGGYQDVFLYKLSGRVQYEDPRLGQLPEGWCVYPELVDGVHIFVNNRTGKIHGNGYYTDPRLTSEELRLRGVDIKTFRLV